MNTSRIMLAMASLAWECADVLARADVIQPSGCCNGSYI